MLRIVFGVMLLLVSPVSAQQPVRLMPDDLHERSWFGISIDSDDATIIVGAIGADVFGLISGAAYLFDANSGQLLRKLVPDDGAENDEFGMGVAIHGDFAIVGATRHHETAERSGTIYVFDVNTGQQLRKLIPDNSAAFAGYGDIIDLHGTTAAIGSPWDDQFVQNGGAVYLFDITTGQQLHKLIPNDIAERTRFGATIAIEGNTLAIGKPDDGEAAQEAGAVYLFDATTGMQQTKLLAPDAEYEDRFGAMLELKDGILAVGTSAHRHLDPPDDTPINGTVYLYDVSTAGPFVEILDRDGQARSAFGGSIASGSGLLLSRGSDESAIVFSREKDWAVYDIFYNTLSNSGGHFLNQAVITPTAIVIAYPYDHTNGIASGALYWYPLDQVGFTDSPIETRLEQASPEVRDYFGRSVDLHGGLALVGAPGAELIEDQSGAAHLFDAATGERVRTFTDPDADRWADFGIAVALHNGRALIGAPQAGARASYEGAAVLFDTASGQKLHRFTAPDPQPGDEFGHRVALTDSIAVVSAFYRDTYHKNYGGVFLFNPSDGAFLKEIVPPNPEQIFGFGRTLAIDGNNLAVGVSNEAVPGFGEVDPVYIFDTNSGQVRHRILSPSTHPVTTFGRGGLAISGDWLAVGDLVDSDVEERAGAVYVFSVSTGLQVWKLYPQSPSELQHFGLSLDLDGDILAVGNQHDDVNAISSGSIELFNLNTGQRVSTHAAAEGRPNHQLGTAIAINGPHIVAGATGRSGESGDAYLFFHCPPDVNHDRYVDVGDISAFVDLFLQGDTAADQNADGILDIGDIAAFVTAFLAGC